MGNSSQVEFGEEAKHKYFSFHKLNVTRLNHGSFGSPPLQVLEAKRAFEDVWNSQPDECYYGKWYEDFEKGEAQLAKFVNCSPDQLSLVDNATTGAVIVAQKIRDDFTSGRYQVGDVVLSHSIIYDAVRKLFQYYLEPVGAKLVEVEIPFPVKDSTELVEAHRVCLKKLVGKKIRLAVVDHISSAPAVIFPLTEICKLLRESHVQEIFVDGAHVVGSIPLDLQQIDCDYYVSNCHKWLFCPSGVAFFYFRQISQGRENLHHPIISHNWKKGLQSECHWIGTKDYSSFFSIPAALKFIETLGFQRILQYNHNLVWKMAKELASDWGTLVGSPESMVGTMANVKLPSAIQARVPHFLDFRSIMREEYKIEVVVFLDAKQDFWVRLAAQIYNSQEDYRKLSRAIISFLKKQ